MRIANREIGFDNSVYIIAEAGVNHNGDIDLAKKLVDLAVRAGVDAVKFQSFKTENLIVADVEKAPYQKAALGTDESQFEMLKRLEMDSASQKELMDYCKSSGITFLSTPFDVESLEELVAMGVEALKIASTDTTNVFLLEAAARSGLPVFLSTGMSSLKEVEGAVKCLYDNGLKDLVIMHCTANYPTIPEEVNLKAMCTLEERFDGVVGFSDHTEGLGATPYAVALGAKVVEKHFTLDKSMIGPDHKASLSPDELKALVQEVRKVERMLGSPKKAPTPSEIETKASLQKCIVAAKPIGAGVEITKEMLTAKRTGGIGISTLEMDKLLGKKSLNDISIDEVIEPSNVK